MITTPQSIPNSTREPCDSSVPSSMANLLRKVRMTQEDYGERGETKEKQITLLYRGLLMITKRRYVKEVKHVSMAYPGPGSILPSPTPVSSLEPVTDKLSSQQFPVLFFIIIYFISSLLYDINSRKLSSRLIHHCVPNAKNSVYSTAGCNSWSS